MKNVTVESLAISTTGLLLAYSLVVFVAYVASLMVLSYMDIYRGDFSLLANLAMCTLFYASLGIHLNPKIEWFGKKHTDRDPNRLLCRALALFGSASTAFLGSAYFYFALAKPYWPLVFPPAES